MPADKYKKFDALAAEKIGYYVYALRDPRNMEVFYVGKGKENRWYSHIEAAQENALDPSLKLQRIREIEKSGRLVEAFIIRSGLKSEKLAYEVEAAVIHSYRLLQKSNQSIPVDLTNVVDGHHSENGLASTDAMQSILNAKEAPIITIPVGIFKIGVLWHPEMSKEEVREATSGWWYANNVKNAKSKAQYAFGVSKGVIRGVYKIDESMWRQRMKPDRDWEDDIGNEPRWGFPDCAEAGDHIEQEFLNKSVKHLFKNGDRNSVRFFNCK